MPRQKRQRLKKRPDGRYRCVYHGIAFYGYTEDEALDAREEYKRQEAAGEYVRKNSQTVEEYADYWLPIHKGDVKQTTYNAYKSLLKNILPPIAGILLKDVSSDDISELYASLNKKSASYIHKAKILISAIFDSAVDAGYIPKNPCRAQSVKPPKGTRGSHRAVTEDERTLILSTPHRMQLAALIMLYCGLRRGEVLALKSSDIHGDSLTVSRSVYYVSNQPIVSAPKSHAGIRTVPIPSVLRPFLSDLRGFVYPGGNNTPATEQAFSRGWEAYRKALSAAAGHPVDIRPHDLRHSYCTMLRDAGVDMKQAMLWMGHADEKMILRIYDHVTDSRTAQSIQMLESHLLKGQNEGQPIPKLSVSS